MSSRPPRLRSKVTWVRVTLTGISRGNDFGQTWLLCKLTLGTVPKVQRRQQKEIHCKGGRGGQEARSYFLDRPSDVDLKGGSKWKLNVFTIFQLSVLLKIIQNELTSDHSIYNSYVQINHICELRISTNCRFPFRGGRGGPLENDHEFPFAGDVELLGRSLSPSRVVLPVTDSLSANVFFAPVYLVSGLEPNIKQNRGKIHSLKILSAT